MQYRVCTADLLSFAILVKKCWTVGGEMNLGHIPNLLQVIKIKSNLHYTHGITPKRVTSCEAHLCGLAPGLHSSKETPQRWRVVGDTVLI